MQDLCRNFVAGVSTARCRTLWSCTAPLALVADLSRERPCASGCDGATGYGAGQAGARSARAVPAIRKVFGASLRIARRFTMPIRRNANGPDAVVTDLPHQAR